MSSGRGSRQAKCSRSSEGLREDEGRLWKGLAELLCRSRRRKSGTAGGLETKALGRAGGKGLGLGDDGASGLWVLTTKAGMLGVSKH